MTVMPARENETAQADTEPAQEALPAPATETETDFKTEGDLPAVAIAAGASGATASEIAFDGKEAKASGDISHLDKGIHHYESYRAACEQAGKPEKWKAHYQNGHTEAAGWNQPYEHRAVNDWTLKKGTSASDALKKWMAGPTIADYRAALLADEIDEVRDEMGDRKFDRLFGSANEGEDRAIPVSQRLRISSDAYTTPLTDQMKAIAAEADTKSRQPNEPVAAPQVETRVEAKQEVVAKDQDPLVVAQELGVEQRDREIV